jgi:hypothetical protein
MKWTQSGTNWMAATWLDDTQVIYLARRAEPDWSIWHVEKKVCGAASRDPQFIGTSRDLEKAKAMAEVDAELPL